MTTPLAFKALEIYANTFQLLETAPLRWNVKTQELEFVSSKKKLLPFFFNAFGIFAFGVFCCGFLVVKYGNKENSPIPLWLIGLFGFGFFLGCIGLFVQYLILAYGKEGTQAFNTGLRLERDFKSCFGKTDGGQSSSKFDFFGLGLMLFNLIIPPYAIILVFAMTLLNRDPFYFVFALVLDFAQIQNSFLVAKGILFLRLFCLYQCVMETGRYVVILITLSSMFAKFANALLYILEKDKKIYKFLHWYSALFIYFNHLNPLMDAGLTVLFPVFLIIVCVVNFLTIKAYGKMPGDIFVFLPAVAIMFCIVIGSVLPLLTSLHTTSQSILTKRKYSNFRYRRYFFRKIVAMRPISAHIEINGYRFFELNNPLRGESYQAIMNYTSTLLLSYDVE